MKQKYYGYFISKKEQGVCKEWKECEKKVKGVKDARFQSFPSQETAKQWLQSGANYELRIKKHVEPGIYFDAGTGRGNGVEISVTDEKGRNLLYTVMSPNRINRFGKHLLSREITNNYGELLACKYALDFALKNHNKKIFGDSKLVVNYWSKGIAREKFISQATSKLVTTVAQLRKRFEAGGGVVGKISGDYNPADLGFH
ncbi:MAG: ribonuclease H family protein [bacterium]|nr:ribonuclease H family protein [bacterium]